MRSTANLSSTPPTYILLCYFYNYGTFDTMARYDPCHTYYNDLLDDEGEEPPTSPIPPGMCGSRKWANNELEEMPEQHVADLIEIEERERRNKGEDGDWEGEGEMEEEANHGFRDLIPVIGQNLILPPALKPLTEPLSLRPSWSGCALAAVVTE